MDALLTTPQTQPIRRSLAPCDVEKALSRYARDLGVPLDRVILATLEMVARDYAEATGNGTIPALA